MALIFCECQSFCLSLLIVLSAVVRLSLSEFSNPEQVAIAAGASKSDIHESDSSTYMYMHARVTVNIYNV